MKHKSKIFNLLMAFVLFIGMAGIFPKPAQAAAGVVVISQVYGGGGNSGATYTHDFIELFNAGGAPVNITGWSVQYASATGTSWQVTALTGILQPGQYYLVQEAQGSGGTTPLPTPDAIGAIPMAATNGKVALVDTTTPLSGACPLGTVDFVGFGTANCSETAPTPALTNTTAAIRNNGGCTDTNNNSADFAIGAPTPRNSASSKNVCVNLEPLINEFSYSTTGTDVEYIEVFGTPLLDYSAFTLLEIEGDTASNPGVIAEVMAVGTTDAVGFYLVSLLANTLQNNSLSLYLVKDFTGALNDDLDTDNDGVLDVTPWSQVADTVAVNDGGAGDISYGGVVLTALYDGLEFTPGGASRIPDGFDTNTITDWMRNDFDLYGIPGNPGTPILGEAVNTPGAPNQAYIPAGDTAPYVASTSPVDGGEILANDNIVITFSEPVTLGSNWFDITCTASSVHSAVVNDEDPVFTLDPDDDFTTGESCTVNIYAAFVTDEDDPPDTMESDYTFTFSVAYGCGDPFTAIPAIQGNGTSSPIVGNVVSTEGIVTADYQTNAYVSGTKNGFFMQSESADGDPATSEGLFIYSTLTDVHVGDHVRVTGTVKEQYDLTELSPVTRILVCSTGNDVEPTEFELPAASLLDFEKFEGMYVTIPQELTIVEYYNFDQFGEIVLGTERFMQFTAMNEPDPTGFAAWNTQLTLNSILLDDGREASNPDPARHPNGSPFTLENLFRGGDKLTNVIGVMDYNFSKYRIQPSAGADYEAVNARTTTPDVDEVPGSLKVASFNVLNYFTTIDTGDLICGPSGTMECRGADTAEELTRQRDKILAALLVIDADVVGVMEIENDKPLGEGELPDYAVADLVAGLNAAAGAGTYAYIATGAIGTDAIKQAIIYKPAAVTPVGTYQLLTSAVDPRFIDNLNRPALAQVFADNRTGESFVVAVNHLKSKGSACPDDPDLLDGAGNCNLTRKAAAQSLVDWLANPTYFPDMENALIIGDLNSYDYEDPIDMIKLGSDDEADTDDDYYDVLKEFRGEEAYGYLYGSQLGYLDYALVNTHLVDYLLDVNFWNINADESDLINYDMTYKLPAQDAIYAPDAYRSSDHDPVILTLLFNTAPLANDMAVSTDEDTPLVLDLYVSDAEGNELTVTILTAPLHGSLDVLGTSVTYTPDGDYNGEDSFTYKVNDWELDSDEATVTIKVTPVNDAPVAVGATYDLPENSYVMFALGVIEVDGDPLSYIIVTEPAHGSLV